MAAKGERIGLPPEAAEAIAKIEHERDEFLSLVAHELKTPLTPLKTVAQLIRSRIRKSREGTRKLDPDALERNAATIERQVDRMDRLVTGLLEVTRIQRGTFELRPREFDLAELVREVGQDWADATAEEGRHRIEVEAQDAIPITGDRERIEQVLMNLIGNAVKFSPSGGVVTIRAERADGSAVVTVRDEGIGIPADELAQVGQQPYLRGRRAAGYAGVGIGLYLTRLVAEGHRGRLEVESEGDDRGTTARLILPT